MARRPPTGGMVARGMAERRKTRRRKSGGGSSGDSKPVRGTAPSAADIDELEKFEPSEEAKQHTPSTVDAMGQDKRRAVVGQGYGPSRRTQVVFFVAVAVLLVVVVGGWLALVSAFDNPPDKIEAEAPWSKQAADAELAAEQQATPVTPLSPCGEPGSEYPVPPQSPCAAPNAANDYQGSGTKASTGSEPSTGSGAGTGHTATPGQ
jgi:hypothetical protein